MDLVMHTSMWWDEPLMGQSSTRLASAYVGGHQADLAGYGPNSVPLDRFRVVPCPGLAGAVAAGACGAVLTLGSNSVVACGTEGSWGAGLAVAASGAGGGSGAGAVVTASIAAALGSGAADAGTVG